MFQILEFFKFWIKAARGYSIPMSMMSWLVPFVFGITDGGIIKNGIIALVGILFAHAGVNLFDDFVDYSIEKHKIKKNIKSKMELQVGKCDYLISGKSTLNQLILAIIICFLVAILCGILLFLIIGKFVLILMIITACMCLMYPILSFFAMGEIVVGIVFGGLLYTGVYYVMTEGISYDLLKLSISTSLLTIGLLHAHMYLDIDFDRKNKKTTLCSLAGSRGNAVRNQAIIMILAYLNIIKLVLGGLSKIYLITLISIPTGIILYRLMRKDIQRNEQEKERESEINPNIFYGIIEGIKDKENIKIKNFMIKFLVARNVMIEFTILLSIAKILSEIY
jgi:1,4-dihydroxy-2-naphthoate octaprenyltransferase